jgi:hypothetical protein
MCVAVTRTASKRFNTYAPRSEFRNAHGGPLNAIGPDPCARQCDQRAPVRMSGLEPGLVGEIVLYGEVAQQSSVRAERLVALPHRNAKPRSDRLLAEG